MVAPLVSVCIPTYNYRRYLPQALESALAQTARDIEVVVVDNCSEDGSAEVIEAYARRDARIAAHRNERNLGMTANFNRGLALARGKYVKLLCADDVLEPECAERLVAALEAEPRAGLAGCARRYFRDDGTTVRIRAYAARATLVPGERAVRECFFKGNLIGEPTAVLFRRSDAGGGFDEAYRQAFDMALWLRLLEGRDFAFLEAPLCGIREHGASGTGANLEAGRVTEDKLRLFERYAPRVQGSPLERLRWDARMASSVAREAAKHAPRRDVSKAVYYPGLFRAATLPLVRALTALRG